MIVELILLTPAEARELKRDAERVLRSLEHRKFCECDRPWLLEGPCGKCGKPLRRAVSAALRHAIEDLDAIATEDCSPSCARCGTRLDRVVLRVGGDEVDWCPRCEAPGHVAARHPPKLQAGAYGYGMGGFGKRSRKQTINDSRHHRPSNKPPRRHDLPDKY